MNVDSGTKVSKNKDSLSSNAYMPQIDNLFPGYYLA
jgi:hypothetical protein